MNIGIFGGTFSPIHSAHLIIAETAREQYELDRVIFMTSGDPPHKTAGVDAPSRFQMTRLAIEGNDRFIDDDYEIKSGGKSYTVHTLEYMKKQYPNDKLFFIIGEDSLGDLGKWYEPEKIISMASLIVFPRVSQESLNEKITAAKEKFGGEILPVRAPVIGLSSTYIRERISRGETVRYMIPDKVGEYIKEHNLYADGD